MSARVFLPPSWATAIIALSLLAVSCGAARSADVRVYGNDGTAVELLAADKRSAAAILPVDAPGTLRFSFPTQLALPQGAAIEFEYTMDEPTAGLLVVFRAEGETVWALPHIAAPASTVIRYRVPLVGSALAAFEIAAENGTAQAAKKAASGRDGKDVPPVFRLTSIRVRERSYGYAQEENALFLTPYVYRERGPSGTRLVVDPPDRHRPAGLVDLRVGFGAGRHTIAAGETSFAFTGESAASTVRTATLPAGAVPIDPFPLVVEGDSYPSFLIVGGPSSEALPFEPVTADPGLISAYRPEAWRDERYEFFRWERFPNILIFDTADYAVQDRLFKRIAFFTEKAGFRGRLAADAEIANLHGWNAHDYRAESLAEFFEVARKTAFPLNTEERELLSILLANGIVVRSGSENGSIEAGEGAVVSISRESEGYLRSLFLTHECYHGIFFVDEDFRRFAETRWNGLDPVARRFLRAYFDMHRYDVADQYLMTNELMAYVLQQPVSSAAKYFGETLPARLERDAVRKASLPLKDGPSNSWPELARLFTDEARAFDSYVGERWGLRAGSVSSFYPISRTNAAR